MSRLVITGGTVLDPASGLNAPKTLLIENDTIHGVVTEIPKGWDDAETIDATGRWVMPGLICLRTHVGEPGTEWKEDIESVSNAAIAGGFTTVCATPNTAPINDVRAVTKQLLARSEQVNGVRILPIAAATRSLAGETLAEMGDLKDAGCVAVSSGDKAIPNAQLLRRVLEYARSIEIPFFTVARDDSMSRGTVMHEGQVSNRLGMHAMPSEAEVISLFRDATISGLAEWPIHIQKISTRATLNTLRQLREAGLNVTVDITPHHLWFNDEVTSHFDTDTRVEPPLRSQDDVNACREAIGEGLIQAIATDHCPQSSVEKAVEYAYAEPGTTGLETTLAAVLDLVHQKELPLMQALSCLTVGPADILGRQDLGRLSEGASADVIIVDSDTPFRAESVRMQSKSRNCIFEGVSLTGVVETTIVKGKVIAIS